jgi:hypothetical protein
MERDPFSSDILKLEGSYRFFFTITAPSAELM